MYVIPKEDIYMVGTKRYFRLNLPAESKLYWLTTKDGNQYMDVNLRDLELTRANLMVHPVEFLRAIVKYIHKQTPGRLSKNLLIEYILENTVYEDV
jgi:hypothetical protein